MKKIYFLLIIFCIIFLESCSFLCKHEHTNDTIDKRVCESENVILTYCSECNKLLSERKEYLQHEMETTVVDSSCSEEGKITRRCLFCNYEENEIIDKKPHTIVKEEIGTHKCLEKITVIDYCEVCSTVVDTTEYEVKHSLIAEEIKATCEENGQRITECENCDYRKIEVLKALGHHFEDYEIEKEPTETECGIKKRECVNCSKYEEIEFTDNTFSYNGALTVEGKDLLNSKGEKMQLIGLSTHGLQWFSRYVNYETFKNIKNEFGINCIRLALYTSEGGYCDVDDYKKEEYFELISDGIDILTSLDLYVIVDWHMVGAINELDKTPLTYLDESMDFFGRLSYKYKDQNNIIYEIMNEPNGTATWNDCKRYANKIIPVIRENTDAIILVGNPSWSSDLNSVMNSPLKTYKNIMYTYHFYANDIKDTTKLQYFYDSGYPVFVSEHGGMDSSGDGEINYNSVRNFYKVMDDRNISYIAWNISNSKGSASIIKYSSYDLYSFEDDNLKDWGIFFKNHTRKKANFK